MSHDSGWLAPTAAIVVSMAVAFFSGAQWWVSRNKLKLDLFDSRWKIYEAARGLLIEICAHARISADAERAFREGIRGARFLFGLKVEHYLHRELWKRATTLAAAVSVVDQPYQAAPDQGAIRAKWDIVEWANAQFDVLDEMFGEYLRVEEGFFERIWRRHGPKS